MIVKNFVDCALVASLADIPSPVVDIGTGAREWAVTAVVRVKIDQPQQRTPIWSQAPVQLDSFQVSPDGRLAGGQFPWPRVGVADLKAGTWRQLGEGCWTALQDVGSPLLWYFDGAHRNLQMVDLAGQDVQAAKEDIGQVGGRTDFGRSGQHVSAVAR